MDDAKEIPRLQEMQEMWIEHARKTCADHGGEVVVHLYERGNGEALQRAMKKAEKVPGVHLFVPVEEER